MGRRALDSNDRIQGLNRLKLNDGDHRVRHGRRDRRVHDHRVHDHHVHDHRVHDRHFYGRRVHVLHVPHVQRVHDRHDRHVHDRRVHDANHAHLATSLHHDANRWRLATSQNRIANRHRNHHNRLHFDHLVSHDRRVLQENRLQIQRRTNYWLKITKQHLKSMLTLIFHVTFYLSLIKCKSSTFWYMFDVSSNY